MSELDLFEIRFVVCTPRRVRDHARRQHHRELARELLEWLADKGYELSADHSYRVARLNP